MSAKALKVVFGASLLLAGMAIGLPAASATVACTTSISNTTVNDGVAVPPGATCVLYNTTVNGSVQVGANASVTLVGATVHGSFDSRGAHDIRIGNCLEFGCAE